MIRWLLFILGFLAGAGTAAAGVVIVLALAQASGTGWQSRHELSRGDV